MNLFFFETFGWIFYWLWITLHVLVWIFILYTPKKTPEERLLWLLTVALLPGIGILFFLFFGVNRINRVQDAVLNAQNALANREVGASAAKFTPPPEYTQSAHNQMLDRLFPHRPEISGNRVEMLHEGTEAYPRMLADMGRAQKCIRLQSFILMSDEVGKKFLDVLEQKASEGVDVKVLFDSFGSFKSYFSRFFLRCLRKKQKNFQIRAFSPINLLAPWRFQLRNHRKLLVIDGHIAYTGGINISAENERLRTIPRARYIHDLHCRVTGPAVRELTLSFFRDWSYTTRRHPQNCFLADDLPELTATGEACLRIVDSGPGLNYEGTRHLFSTAALQAQKSLVILTPYMVPGPEYVELLCLTAERGVDVKIIVPQNNNHKFVDWAARSFYPEMLARGVHIFERQGLFSHTKALLVDDAWGFMGSSNCDSRSFRLNFELDFCFEGGEFIKQVVKQVRIEQAISRELHLSAIEKRGFAERLLENGCALLTPIL